MNKWVPEQPSPWRKSSKRESCYGDRVYARGLIPGGASADIVSCRYNIIIIIIIVIIIIVVIIFLFHASLALLLLLLLLLLYVLCLAGPTRHILPPSEIDLGLFWANFTNFEGKHLFHRIG